ncbi:MAG TPA: hypothetical protein VK146_07265, partial [Tabrizicola sp.]|nr:hypothetical protein [Tabrizicola sp.]
MSANDLAPKRRLRDFPVVFLSYDEPWADRNWLDLRSSFPHVVRVHGVKGLDACHKAAADAVPGDWVVTVDADTRVASELAEAPVPNHLLTGDFRLDWRARNVVNGLWSGNGSVKLWPKALIREMRTHEAAPEGTVSLDHDINAIRRGKSVQVTMPERAASTDPAQTAFHAFRSGLRETAFFRSLATQATERRGSGHWRDETELLRLIEIWCSIGRHAFNGRWMLYGARLGLLLPDLWPDWDPREVNDHDAIHSLWQGRVAPLFQRGPGRGLSETAWNWQALESGLRSLSSEISARGGPEIVELDAARSGQMARTPDFASPVRAARLDALGYRLMVGASTPTALEKARVVLEQAAVLDHASAHVNMATLLGKLPQPQTDRADWHLSAAAALGNETAIERRAGRPAAATAAELPVVAHGADTTRKRQSATAAQPFLVLDPDVTLLPIAERHVPDPALVADGTVLGYLALCPITGLPRPRGVRLARRDRTGFPPDAFFPLVLARLPAPR